MAQMREKSNINSSLGNKGIMSENGRVIKLNRAGPRTDTQDQTPDHNFPFVQTPSDFCHMEVLFIKF